ncbi:MAG: dihydropteroate synthase [Lachnospiraceae bacterium]
MIIIGEKINGSIPSVTNAIKKRDETFIRNLVWAQIHAVQKEPYFEEPEPFYLDLCAACDPSEEAGVLHWLITQAQSVLEEIPDDIRLCLDSPNPQTLLECMKDCSHPGILNSASLETDENGITKAELLFSAIRGTDWGCSALLLENGITHTVRERMDIFHRLCQLAEKYDIRPSQLYIDPLSEAASVSPGNFPVFEQCCRSIRSFDDRIHIISGASNISYGFSRIRRPLNTAFLALAIHAGMDSTILDPTDRTLLGVLYATELITGKDEDCLGYIKAHRQGLF